MAAFRWLRSRWSAPPPQIASPTTPVRKRPSVDFSLTGAVYCSMMLLIGLAAINSQANLLFGVFGLMIGILLVSALICRLVLTGLIVRRILPEAAAVGQAATIHYEFINKKKFWPSFSVVLAELEGAEAFTVQPHAYILHAAGGNSALVPVIVVPKRRGVHRLSGYQLSTSFPFGFIKRAIIRRAEDTFLIYPAIGGVSPRLLALCSSAERGGANMKPRLNGTDEFYGVKEFRAGENPRWIYWKRSARTGTLVAREMVQISPPRLLILVDTFIESPTQYQHATVEKTIAMAASLASRAMDSGIAAGLCAWTGDWTSISMQRGKRHCRDILSALAQLPINRTAPVARLIEHAQALAQDGVTTMLFTPRKIQLSLAEKSRGEMVIISADSERAASWFRFDPQVDFERSMPIDQTRGIWVG
jgi:uncharacterized protein (DUF58 family)